MYPFISKLFAYYQKIPFKLIICLFSIFIFFFFLHPIDGDGDFFHDLNTGRYILLHKQLPQTDEWTFTAYGKPWVANAWGTGVIYYVLYKSLGPSSISIFIALQAVLLFLLIYSFLRSYNINKQVSLLSVIFGLTIISIRWPNRPELTTYPFIISLLLIYKLRMKYPKVVLFLPFLIFLWSIFYSGSIFTGLILLIILCGLQFFNDKFTIKRQNIPFYISALLSLLVSLLNGYGFQGIFYIFLIPAISKIQGEWMGIFTVLELASSDQLLQLQYEILLFFIYLLVMFLLMIYKRKILKKYPLELLLVCGLLTPFFAIRNIPLAVLLSLPLLAILLTQLNMKIKKTVFVVIICLTLFNIFIAWRINEHGVGQDPVSFPPDIIRFFSKHNLSGNVFTNQQTGSYISYELYPKVLVYSDTRDDLFVNTNVLTDFQNTVSRQKNVIPLLTKYRADIVLADGADGNSYQPLLYSKDWSLVYVDDKYLLFIPTRIAKDKKLVAYTAIDPFALGAAKNGLENQALIEYEKILSQNYSFNTLFHIGQILLNQKNYSKTIEIANKMSVPTDMSMPLFQSRKDYLLATAYLLTNQCTTAKQYLDAYHNDLSYKFIFNLFEKLPGIDEKEYMIYYLVCAHNVPESTQHLLNYLNDPQVSENDKVNAKNLYNSLTNSL